MTLQELHAHINNLANSRCKSKHRDYYDSLICVGPASSHFGPPCDSCIAKVREEYEKKLGKAHDRELSPEEVAEIRKNLGID